MATRLYVHNDGVADPESFGVESIDGLGMRIMAAKTDNAGNIYTTANNGGASLTQKYDGYGQLLWQAYIYGVSTTQSQGLAVGPTSGNVYVAAYTGAGASGGSNTDGLILKYDTTGALQWQRNLGGTGLEYFLDVGIDSSENVYVTGRTDSQGGGGGGGAQLTAKYNSSGVLQWQRTLDGALATPEQGSKIAVDSSGNVHSVGYTGNLAAGAQVGYLITKYNTSGTIQWQRGFTAGAFNYGQGAAVDSSGNVYFAGYGATDVVYTAYLGKYNSAGTLQWQRALSTPANFCLGTGLAVDSSANVYMTGYGTLSGNEQSWIAKYDTNGTFLWVRGISGGSNNYAPNIYVDNYGYILVTLDKGSTNQFLRLLGDGSDIGNFSFYYLGTVSYEFDQLRSSTSTGTSSTTTFTDAAGTLSDTAGITTQSTITAPSRRIPWTWVSTSSFEPPQNMKWWLSLMRSASNDDRHWSLNVDINGNLLMAGRTVIAGVTTAQVVKYTADGKFSWGRTLGGKTSEANYGVTTDSSGNVYTAGYTQTQGAGLGDFLIAKYNSAGTIQFQRSLGGAAADLANAIAIDSSSNAYIAGYYTSGTNLLGLIAKYNSAGTIQWQRGLSGPGTQTVIYGVSVDSADNILTTGLYRSGTNNELFLAKWDPSGSLTWQRSLQTPGADSGYAVGTDSSNNIYVAGSYGSGVATNLLVAKWNSSGTLQWQVGLSGSGNKELYGIAVTPDGTSYVTGIHSAGPSQDIFAGKLDSQGTVIWQRGLSGSSATDWGYGVALDRDENPYLAGYTASVASPNIEALLYKLAPEGTTGQFGVLNYVPTFYSVVNAGMTDTAAVLSATTTTLTEAARTLTDGATTATYTTGFLNYPFGATSANAATTTNTIWPKNMAVATGPASGITQSSDTIATLANTSAQKQLLGVFYSPTLDVDQTVGGGNMTINTAAAESNLAVNFLGINAINAYVWRPSTQTKVGTIKDATASLGGAEPSAINQEEVSAITGITSAAVSASAGDVIVCELWTIFTQGMATAYTATWYYDGTTVTTVNNTVVTNHASFIEFSETLTFGPPAAPKLLPKSIALFEGA